MIIEEMGPTGCCGGAHLSIGQKNMKQQKNKFEYDACGNMTYEYMRGNGTGGATTEVFYTYDELHQVVTAKENYGNKTRTYQYDSLGNLTYETGHGNMDIDYKLNNLNQLVEKTYSKGKKHTVYTYDGQGNLIEEEYGKNKKTATVGAYTFDETNWMVLGVNADSESSAYTFNGLGALVEQTWTIKKNSYGYHEGSETAAAISAQTEAGAGGVLAAGLGADVDNLLMLGGKGNGKGKGNGNQGDKPGHKPNQMITVVKQFFPDYTRETLDPLVENEEGGLEYRYVYGNERLSVNITGIENGAGSIVENGNQVRFYYHQDLRGTVDYLTSPVSQKIESWTHYNEWGEITHNTVLKCGQRELDLVKNYTGHEYDAVLNLYFAKARFYDAENRRFISMDPVKGRQTDPISMVQYLYYKNNSLIYIDPTGEVIEEFRVWLSGEGWKTVDELAKEGVRWANWENILSEKIAKELNEKGIGKIEDDALRVLLTDTVIYKNAQELQDEFYTIYIASGPAISASHIIHTTLEPLYEEYQVPVDPDKEFWNGLFNAFNAGISVGMDFATMEMIADASYVNTNKSFVYHTKLKS